MKFLQYLLSCFVALSCLLIQEGTAQDGWTKEGNLRRWRGAEITGTQFGCSAVTGNPTIELDKEVAEIDLVTGASTKHVKPTEEGWKYVPRNANLMIKVELDTVNSKTTIYLFNVVQNGLVRDLEADVSTATLTPDPADVWASDDGSIGAVVFAPTSATPADSLWYVILLFDKTGVRQIKKVKPKVDLDIYVRPDPDDAGVLVYLRGNGLQLSGYQDEVFTNASYIYFNPDGQIKQLNLPERGPGSGKGRKIIWHSNKYDRLVFADEYASGIFLVKASNGIPIDTVEHLSIEPAAPLRIISASGNKTDKWMVTHAKTGDKNVLVLWAMPETREVTTVQLETSDPAIKQMPLSPWSVVIPILSVSQSGNALYAWDAQDVLSVDESTTAHRALASPLPTSHNVSIPLEGWSNEADYRIVNSLGQEVLGGSGTVAGGSLTVNVQSLQPGIYTAVVTNRSTNHAKADVVVSTIMVAR